MADEFGVQVTVSDLPLWGIWITLRERRSTWYSPYGTPFFSPRIEVAHAALLGLGENFCAACVRQLGQDGRPTPQAERTAEVAGES